MSKIPNILHILYIKDNNIDINVYEYFFIKSYIEINNPNKIYFHCNIIPNGKLFDKINTSMIVNKIDIPENKFFFIKKYKYAIIYKKLFDYGGVYIDIKSICIKPINHLLKYNFFKSKDNEIIGSEKGSYMAIKYFEYYFKNKVFKEIYSIYYDKNNNIVENHLIENLYYNNSEQYLQNIIFNEINDYSFGEYFHLIKNCYFLNLSNNSDLDKITIKDIFNKITYI